jgi:hypothetical protein
MMSSPIRSLLEDPLSILESRIMGTVKLSSDGTILATPINTHHTLGKRQIFDTQISAAAQHLIFGDSSDDDSPNKMPKYDDYDTSPQATVNETDEPVFPTAKSHWYDHLDLQSLFGIEYGADHSPLGLLLFRGWSCLQICELDHYLSPKLRALIRPTFEVYCAGLFPIPLLGTRSLRAVYSWYRDLFAPCNPDDDERISRFMAWVSRPKIAFPFIRLYSTWSRVSRRALIWDYMSDPISFLCSFKDCLDFMPPVFVWEFKLLHVEYLQDPHYLRGGSPRPICPGQSRDNFPFLVLLDESLDFEHLWKIHRSPMDPLTMSLLPAILRSRTGPSSCLDPTILDLCQLQIHYRIIPRLTRIRDFHLFYHKKGLSLKLFFTEYTMGRQ